MGIPCSNKVVIKSNHGGCGQVWGPVGFTSGGIEGERIRYSVYEVSQDPWERPRMHLVGACTSLTARNVPRRSRKRQCVCNLSWGEVCHAYLRVWTLSAAVRTSQVWFYIFIAGLGLSQLRLWAAAVLGPLNLETNSWNKQTDWATAWRAALLTLWISPSDSAARPQTHTCYQSVCRRLIVQL